MSGTFFDPYFILVDRWVNHRDAGVDAIVSCHLHQALSWDFSMFEQKWRSRF